MLPLPAQAGRGSAFQPLDKAFLAGTRAPAHSFAPVWRLEYRGPLTEEILQTALDWTVAKYPSAAARVVALDGPFDRATRFAWEIPEGTPSSTPLGQTGGEDVLDRFIDLEREPPLRCTWMRTGDQAGVIALQQHHSLADGRAFLAFISDFVRALDAASRRAPNPLSGVVGRRPERETVPDSGVLDWLRVFVASIVEVFRTIFTPVQPLKSNLGADFEGPNRTRHLLVPLAQVEALKRYRETDGLSTNDLLAGTLCAALSRWSRSAGRHTLFMPIDTRPRDAAFESFANHLSSVQVRWRARPDATALELAKEIRDAVKPVMAARLPWRRVRFDGALVAMTPIHVLRTQLLDKRRLVTNFSFSNLIPLGTPGACADGRWRFGEAVIENVFITTPCTPPQGVNLTVAKYGDSVCFNFNYKASAVSEADVEALARAFETELSALVPHPLPGSRSPSERGAG